MRLSEIVTEAANPAQQAAIAISMKKRGKKPKKEGLDANQRRAGQAGPDFVPRDIRVLGKQPVQHPFKGKLVGGGI